MTKKKTAKKQIKKERLSTSEKQQNKQLIIFFVAMLILLGGFLMSYFYALQQNKFSYAGIDFEKGKTGEVVYYHGRVQMPSIYEGKQGGIHNIYLRFDPRKNNVPINVEDFGFAGQVAVAFEPGIEKCDKAVIAHEDLIEFLGAFPWVDRAYGAVTNKEYAEKNKVVFANCSSGNEYRTIVLVQISETPSIEKEGDYCYILNIGECDYRKVSERFIMGIVAKINKEQI
jgi:hypothetical protein